MMGGWNDGGDGMMGGWNDGGGGRNEEKGRIMRVE